VPDYSWIFDFTRYFFVRKGFPGVNFLDILMFLRDVACEIMLKSGGRKW
jgi:hypothetical protein